MSAHPAVVKINYLAEVICEIESHPFRVISILPYQKANNIKEFCLCLPDPGKYVRDGFISPFSPQYR